MPRCERSLIQLMRAFCLFVCSFLVGVRWRATECSGALARGQEAALKILEQHQQSNAGQYPETVAVTLWGLDAIKTRGESVAILLALVGAKPVLEGTGPL